MILNSVMVVMLHFSIELGSLVADFITLVEEHLYSMRQKCSRKKLVF